MSNYADVMRIIRLRSSDATTDWMSMSGTKMVVIGRNGDILQEVDGWGTSKDRERFTNILKTYVDDDDRTGTVHPVITISHATSAPSITTAFVPPRKDLVINKQFLNTKSKDGEVGGEFGGKYIGEYGGKVKLLILSFMGDFLSDEQTNNK